MIACAEVAGLESPGSVITSPEVGGLGGRAVASAHRHGDRAEVLASGFATRARLDLRREFMTRVIDLCRAYGISRKTGDKYKQRLKR